MTAARLFDVGPETGRLGTFFPYYGAKWLMIRGLYPRPEHPTIVEPFAGSATTHSTTPTAT